MLNTNKSDINCHLKLITSDKKRHLFNTNLANIHAPNRTFNLIPNNINTLHYFRFKTSPTKCVHYHPRLGEVTR